MKYKDVKWTGVGAPVDNQMLAANGIYTGQQVGTPAQGHGETAANKDPFYAEHNTVHMGAMTQDAKDSNAPKPLYEVFYDLNGAVGTVPDSQVQPDFEGAITLSAAPTITTYPSGMRSFKAWNTANDGTGEEKAASSSFTPTKDTVLYATYQA